MPKASVWFLAPVLALSSLVVACGDDGGDDGGDEAKAGASGSGQPSGSSGAGGKSSSGGSGGASTSAGAGGKVTGAGGKTGTSGNVTGSTKLSEIDTAEEAQAACERAVATIDESELEAGIEATCTFSGILAAALGGGDCEDAKAACLADPDDAFDCSSETDDIPDCEDVTVDEYIACSVAQMKVATEFFEGVTCETPITDLPMTAPETPAACVPVYAACPELAPSMDLE